MSAHLYTFCRRCRCVLAITRSKNKKTLTRRGCLFILFLYVFFFVFFSPYHFNHSFYSHVIPSCMCSLYSLFHFPSLLFPLSVLYLFSAYILFLASIEPNISQSLSIHISDSFHSVSSLIFSLCIFLFHLILSLILLFFFLFFFLFTCTLYLARTPHLYVLHTSCRRSWREVWRRGLEYKWGVRAAV